MRRVATMQSAQRDEEEPLDQTSCAVQSKRAEGVRANAALLLG
jgi:hypothetical protein